MELIQIQSLLPLIVLSASVILLLISASLKGKNLSAFIISSISFITAFVSILFVPRDTRLLLFISDSIALYFTGLIIIACLAVLMLAYRYMGIAKERFREFCILLELGAMGAFLLVSAVHFISVFLGLEILSVSLYGMIGYRWNYSKSVEAGIKYLVLAAAASSFMLFGMALFYSETGLLWFSGFQPASSVSLMIYFSFALFITGLGFKLALAPFHIWVPDVYEGSPAPVTAFIATVSKGAVFALLIRFFFAVNAQANNMIYIFIIISVASMFTGNLLALRQNNLKRMLAYSSISHMGYLTVALICGTEGMEAVLFYMTSYFAMTICAFGTVSVISGENADSDSMEDYKGLAWKYPLPAVALTLSLLSLAGIPLTAGFIGKYYIIFSGVKSSLWMLVAVLIINSVISAYYYLRVIFFLYDTREENAIFFAGSGHLSGKIVIIFASAVLVWFGIYPQTIINLINIFIIKPGL